jgi:4-diphosphocytidyl-2C-methyl-D-erythritol kinase
LKNLIAILLLAWSAQATTTNVLQSVKLTTKTRLVWDANPETDIAGYRVFMFSGSGSSITPTVTTQVYILRDLLKTNLVGTNIFTFYVTAFNTAGLESEPSDALEVPLSMAEPQAPSGFFIEP